MKYQPQEFEKKWIEIWDKEKTFSTNNQSPITHNQKSYVLAMFPYPSGAGLHVGHVRNYTGTDVLARYMRMSGFSVLQPMGWDAFGLPAENAAVKAKKNPMDMVPTHIATFKKQMMSLGFSNDWDREFSTTDPNYYKWTQWLFIQFYKMGLLYKKNAPINYCPKCKTGLAEEEVLADGTHERCGNKIEKRDLPQWVFRITKYADRLLSDLEGLDWPKGILEMQKNWIGRKEGININYDVIDSSLEFFQKTNKTEKIRKGSSKIIDKITCFTTRPDTNFGATFIVIAPEHKFVKKIINKEFKITNSELEKINKYVEVSNGKTEIERGVEGRKKTGVFTGFYAVNNLNGKLLPIWISDFVLSNFGTGAVVGVPAHDLRDYDFAKEFGIEIIRVVVGKDGDKSKITKREQVQEEKGIMINSEFLDGLDIHVATKKIMDYLEEKGWGKRVTTYHLRDWIFSRQRYWGEPIPMVFCEKCNWNPIPESELPLKLPYIKSYEPTETGESPLSVIPEFVNTKCPKCGGPAKRETDTMPNWAGSCWYFIAFAFWNNKKDSAKQFFQNTNKTEKITSASSLIPSTENWKIQIKNSGNYLPVNWYLGGAEHAVLHLLYSRFWVKALYDLKLLDFKEPFLRLRNQGMILAEDHRKMSKSFGNVINPDDVIKEFGADALRIYEMFMAPFNQEISWATKSLHGSYRFVKRVWDLFQKYEIKPDEIGSNQIKSEEDKRLVIKLQKTIKKVTSDIPEVKFNTAIASMMGFINEWEKTLLVRGYGLSGENAKKFLQILAPFAPFMTEEIWRNVFEEKKSIHLSKWPTVTGEIVEEEIILPVQINGKLRETLRVSSYKLGEKEKIIEQALKSEKLKKYIIGKPKKVIYIPGKIINFIV